MIFPEKQGPAWHSMCEPSLSYERLTWWLDVGSHQALLWRWWGRRLGWGDGKTSLRLVGSRHHWKTRLQEGLGGGKARVDVEAPRCWGRQWLPSRNSLKSGSIGREGWVCLTCPWLSWPWFGEQENESDEQEPCECSSVLTARGWVLQKVVCWNPKPRYLEYDLIWRWGLHKAKTEVLRVGPNPAWLGFV